MSDTPAIIAYLGAFAGLVGGGIALFNARKGVQWKRAELANSYMRDLSSDQVLVFACRALDWNGGRLVVPDSLRPLLPEKSDVIKHDPVILRRSMREDLLISEMDAEPRIQVYRTALDELLSWLSLVASALERNLFAAEDVRSVGYWVFHMEKMEFLDAFIRAYGYLEQTRRLRSAFRHLAHTYAYQSLSGSVDGSTVPSEAD